MPAVPPIKPVLMPVHAATPMAPSAPAAVAARSAMTVMPARLWIPILQPQPPSLPLAGSQSGNLLRDRFNPALRWFLPQFALVDDPDPCFAFAAAQDRPDRQGNPFNSLRLTIGLRKTMPADASAFKAANPAIELREVSLHGLAARLSAPYKDASTGADSHSDFKGSIQPADGGLLQVVLDNTIIGDDTILVYDDLVQFGGVWISLAANYDAWFPKPAAQPAIMLRPFQRVAAMPPPAAPATPLAARMAIGPQNPPAPPPPQFVQGTLPFQAGIPVDRKYAAHVYQLKYTIAAGGATRTIVNVQDLTSFNVKQSEFTELTALGNVNAKYPSLVQLYLGALSRTIVAVPARYAIVRDATHCGAACAALLDSASGDASACKFQFSFVLAPHVSPIELAQLAQEIAAHPEIRDCTLRFPEALADASPSALDLSFGTAVFSRGGEPQNFSLSIEIDDAPGGAPATASANLFIKRLSAAAEPYLGGTLRLKLDDAYPTPISAAIVLNFKETSAVGRANDPTASGLTCSFDETAQTIAIANASTFDLLLARYALATARGVLALSAGATLVPGQTMSVPLPADRDGLAVLTDCELALPGGLAKEQIAKYMHFDPQDVQNVRYAIGINASTIDFDAMGIAKLDARVGLIELPQLSIPAMSLSKFLTLSSATILLPIEYGITSLKATIQFHLEFKDATTQAIDFTVANDFNDKPIFVLSKTDIPAPSPGTT